MKVAAESLDEMKITTKTLDHHGLVTATCRELGIVEIIDREIKSDVREKITTGECVLAMILNGLGFTTKPLYITPRFFEDKPLEILIKEGIEASDLNDDKLGRTLDKLYEAGCDNLFSKIAFHAAGIFKVNMKFQHLDTTVMSVSGEYENECGGQEVLITYGRPKDGIQNSKQYLISLLVSNDGGIPLLAKSLPGNKADQTHFREVLKSLKKEIKLNQEEIYYVADSALYSEKNVKEITASGVKFITHVPSRIKEVEILKSIVSKEYMTKLNKGYRIHEACSTYGDIKQRWLIVYSQKAFDREDKIIKYHARKENEDIAKKLKKLSTQVFSCKEDAVNEFNKIIKSRKYHESKSYSIEETQKKNKRGKSKAEDKIITEYFITGEVKYSKLKLRKAKKQAGIFVLATNELDEKLLPSEEILSYYKGQDKVEKGFRFLKNPLCMAEAVFLKSQERIVALSMVMCLCLLVYSMTQRKLRKVIEEQNETVIDQLGKPTKRPTMRWIYQLFQGIHVVYMRIENVIKTQVTNIKDYHKHILNLLGHQYEKIYYFHTVTCGM